MSTLIEQAHSREWFYSYELPDGSTTPTYHGIDIQAIHDTRWQMLESCLEKNLGAERSGLSALDLASHQGWFAYNMARAGFSRVLGIDARQAHVDDSSLISDIYGMEHLAFRKGDIHEQSPDQLGRFDVVLMLGLLYHLENPVGALRVCRALCNKLCVIETQIVPGMTGFVDYGSYQYVRPLKGSFGIIDETGDTHGPEASITGVCLVPSLDALMWLLEKVGFSSAEVLEPPEGAYEQLRYHKRVMVAARV
ncbi:MAG: tRNA 5-methoxyuridine(34)/uridine 5-oxyacetic acid(34) synthase CmoB [Xanthomonadales bacterium]|nr:tRNA 5-methoxyuridine(34)/uridine 5-oxyacetic acid(34) synthase CmoB [Xanthomonadales bacterium]